MRVIKPMPSPFFCYLAIILIITACSTKSFHPETYPQQQIRFGSGGGFTGFVRQYALLDNGHLYKQEGADSTFTFIEKLSKKQIRSFFKDIPAELVETSFHHPGNRYYFVAYHTSTQTNRLTWGDMQHPIGDTLENFYKRLQRLVPSSQP